MDIKCYECGEKGLTSTWWKIMDGECRRVIATEPNFYDENGKYHCHEQAIVQRHWYCTNGHHRVREAYTTPTCCTAEERAAVNAKQRACEHTERRHTDVSTAYCLSCGIRLYINCVPLPEGEGLTSDEE
jgi:hypothetical protein